MFHHIDEMVPSVVIAVLVEPKEASSHSSTYEQPGSDTLRFRLFS